MPSRRAFLQQSAGLAGIAATAASTAAWFPASTATANTAARGWLSASERITVGVIGPGTMGRGHLSAMLGRNDVEVVAVCDVVRERLDAAVESVKTRYAPRSKAGEFSGIASYLDFRDLLLHPGLDAVLIATPDHWHAIPCILAARAGKHIYCEKPLTHNIAEGRRIVAEAQRTKIVFQTGSQQRSEFGGHFRRAVEAIWNGRIGKIKTIRIGVGDPAVPCDLPQEDIPAGTDWDRWLGPAALRGYNAELCPNGVHKHFPAWRRYREFAGGGLADMGAHHFDIAQWALEMDHSGPVEIIPPDAPRNNGLRFVYANGVEMWHNEFDGQQRTDCIFEGTDGVIRVSREGISATPETVLTEPLPESARRVMPSDNHHENWLAAIRNGGETICTAETGHRSASICHLANIGYSVREKLTWDPAAEEFIGNSTASNLLSRKARGEWGGV